MELQRKLLKKNSFQIEKKKNFKLKIMLLSSIISINLNL